MTLIRESPASLPPGEGRAKWTVTLTGHKGERFPAQMVEIDGPATGERTMRALRSLETVMGVDLPQRGELFDDFGSSQGPVPGRDAISEWGQHAVNLWERTGQDPDAARPIFIETGLAWLEGSRQITAAWHDETVLAFYLPPE